MPNLKTHEQMLKELLKNLTSYEAMLLCINIRKDANIRKALSNNEAQVMLADKILKHIEQ